MDCDASHGVKDEDLELAKPKTSTCALLHQGAKCLAINMTTVNSPIEHTMVFYLKPISSEKPYPPQHRK